VDQDLKSRLLDRKAVQAFFGGTKPLHGATVYRHIRAGPAPVKISAGCSRWSLAECEAALARMMGGSNV
jgi:predicted DNA-binding transcriptional regulator AlpA